MPRQSRRAFLAIGAAGLAVAACSVPSPLGLRRPDETPDRAPDRAPDRTPIAPAPGHPSTGVSPTVVPVFASASDGYVAVAPRILRAGQTESISLSLFEKEQPASGRVTVSLAKSGQTVASASASIAGRGTVPIQVPDLADGDYDLRVSTSGFQDQAPVRVENGTLVFLETDKPIYKPGQTIHFRVLALAPSLKPARGEATLDVLDAKGIKVFRKTVTVDDFGMAGADLPLSNEPNLGVWKAQATIGQRTAELDVRVEEYVLPKYEVTVDLPRDWALVTDPITGTVAAQYSYGKPVRGEVEVSALRYVGTWQQYAHLTQSIDGKASFQIPPVRYAAGSPAGGGLANVRLDVTVREPSTGYEETSSELVTIAAAPVHLELVPESTTFKPTLPFSLLLVAQTPDKKPVDVSVDFNLVYQDSSFKQLTAEMRRVDTTKGLATLKITPPQNAATIQVAASARDAAPAHATLRAGYSPSGSFIHVEQVGPGTLAVGDTARFAVSSTRDAKSFFFEVVARGQVAFSDFAPTADLSFTVTPTMAPESRLLVYQILSNGEVAADYVPFKVTGDFPQKVGIGVDRAEVKPGDSVGVSVQTEGTARVGLAAVDKSVFILAENRLNLQQVFDELETLYLKPQVELHDAQPLGPFGPVTLPGAKEIFQDAGVVVLTNRQVPESKQIQPQFRGVADAAGGARPMAAAAPALQAAAAPTASSQAAGKSAADSAAAAAGLAAVQRVRQFFPETWIWSDLSTDATGRLTQKLTAPDSITTWMLRAVALSKDKGLGIGEAQLRVFQPFFVQVDLPYSAIRGEQFPVKVALYNYQSAAQQFVVELEAGDWFDLVDVRSKTVTVDANAVGGVSFTIRPTDLGVRSLKVTARSPVASDAIVKNLIVEPEGVKREVVENVVVSPAARRSLDLAVPGQVVPGSARAFVALTGNVLSQTIQGLDGLLQMPFGCGEQNMINFAPDVFISRYLKATNQLKPEVLAKADLLMLTGYQRELTYRRSDGSFSAFGEQDQQGSLFLTAFVLKTFAQARDLVYVDDGVLSAARDWIRGHQNADGSFDPFGFVHHQDLLGGLKGKTALTAYVAIALKEAGDDSTARRAIGYLEGILDATTEPYALATAAYALGLAKSGRAQAAHDKLMAIAHQSDDGLYWGDQIPLPVVPPPIAVPEAGPPVAIPGPGIIRPPFPVPIRTASVETTGYATLALLVAGDKINASRAVNWLSAQRNAQGGFGSTQDTVVALEAMTSAAQSNRADTDATLTLRSGSWSKQVRVASDNVDVLQVIEAPVGQTLTVDARGKGQVMLQAVRRYNLPAVDAATQSAFQIDVSYGTDKVEVDDRITVTASITFTPPEPLAAGMVVLDVAVPTGFEPVTDTLAAAVKAEPKLKRWDVAGRKVILYVEDMLPNDHLAISFQARALYPVRAQAVASQVYAYYRPDWKAESLGGAVVVGAPA